MLFCNFNSMQRVYTYLGNLIDQSRVLEIEVQFLFQFQDGRWTEPITLKAFLDTGATHTHISKEVVPPEILEENKSRVIKGGTGTDEFDGINIPNCLIGFPGTDNSGAKFNFHFYSAVTFDDSKRKQRQIELGIPYCPLIIGIDVLERAVLTYDGPSKRYTLQFADVYLSK